MNARDDDPDRGDGFLGRWIRRKAEAREQPEAGEATPEGGADETPDATELTGQAATGGAPDEPAFDLAKLPSLEEINGQTNLTDFMRKEVPAVLRNAALRRAWALDPAIRDYVNPAREYAYDWNVPGGVPGNGPIEAGYDALKHVAKTLWSKPEDDTLGVGKDTVDGAPPAEQAVEVALAPTESVRRVDFKETMQIAHKQEEMSSTKSVSERESVESSPPCPQKRRHGGAAPV